MNRPILLFFAAALLAGCKIVQTTTSGGSIVSSSGSHDCPEDSVCEVDVPNGQRFADTFVAVPNNGYAFAGWHGSESYLCAGVSPTCAVDIPASVTAYDATGYMTAEFHHEPELVFPGTLGSNGAYGRARPNTTRSSLCLWRISMRTAMTTY